MTEKTITKIATVKPIKLNEGTPLYPLDINSYIENPAGVPIEFNVTMLEDNDVFPKGIAFDRAKGLLAGKAEKGSARTRPYRMKILAIGPENKLEFDVELKIYEPKAVDDVVASRKEAWKSLIAQGVLPEDFLELVDRPITQRDIYYLLGRFASFTLWNADDLRLAENGKLIQLEGASDKFNVYDFEVCLVTTPKDLYSYDRTLGDAVQTAKAMMHYAHEKKWHVELGGFDRMADAAWYEAYDLNKANANSHHMEIRNYEPAAVKTMMSQQPLANPS